MTFFRLGMFAIRFVLFVSFLKIVAPVPVSDAAAGGIPTTITNAFLLNTVPSEYKKLEILFKSLKDDGANTVIVRMSMNKGRIARRSFANQVYCAHRFGLRIFVILPTRDMDAVLAVHPDWEDLQYDLSHDLWLGNLQNTGRLDLFNPRVIVYLTDLYRDIAAYAVDGILLDEDFFYRDTEGLSKIALEKYSQKFGSPLVPGKIFDRVKNNAPTHALEEYGTGFWDWAELKKNRLALLLKNIVQSSRAVNKDVKFGIPLHVSGFTQEKEQLAWYAYDLRAFRKVGIDLYWIAIPLREIREQEHLSYMKSMEVLSRTVKAAATQIEDPAQAIFAIQAATQSGRPLPASEIEEEIEMVMHAGEPGIAFMVNADTHLSPILTKKTFAR